MRGERAAESMVLRLPHRALIQRPCSGLTQRGEAGALRGAAGLRLRTCVPPHAREQPVRSPAALLSAHVRGRPVRAARRHRPSADLPARAGGRGRGRQVVPRQRYSVER